MIHKTKTARRHFRRTHIEAKLRILRKNDYMYHETGVFIPYAPIGTLSKGKVHCSCPLCACKSTTDRGIKTNSKRNYSKADITRMEKLDYSMKEYLSA